MTNILTIYHDLEQKRNSNLEIDSDIVSLSFIQSLTPQEIWNFLLKKQVISEIYEQDLLEAPEKFLSVEELLNDWENKEIVQYNHNNDTSSHEDVTQICLITLWQHAHPHQPCLELFEFFVQQGYFFTSAEREEQALQEWRKAGEVFLYVSQKLQKHGIYSIRQLLEQGYEIDTWIQDYFSALLETYELTDLSEMRNFSQKFLQLFPKERDVIIDSIKICYAQSFCLHEDYKKSDALYEECLKETPDWVRGWISWADTYWIYDNGAKSLTKAISILENALDKVFPRDRIEILLRLRTIYQKSDLQESVKSLAKEIEEIKKKHQELETSQDDPLIKELMKKCNLSEKDF